MKPNTKKEKQKKEAFDAAFTEAVFDEYAAQYKQGLLDEAIQKDKGKDDKIAVL